MLPNNKNKALIKNLHQCEECGSRRILTKFLEETGKGKDWTLY